MCLDNSREDNYQGVFTWKLAIDKHGVGLGGTISANPAGNLGDSERISSSHTRAGCRAFPVRVDVERAGPALSVGCCVACLSGVETL